ncbi:MAG: hypothetical protein ACR2PK_02510, partial [Acidimicrobiales bacterium]
TIARGSILTEAAIYDPSQAAPATDRATVAIPNAATIPPVQPGAALLIVVNADPFSGLEPSVIGAIVTEVSEERIVVSVDLVDLPETAAALNDGSITIARRS